MGETGFVRMSGCLRWVAVVLLQEQQVACVLGFVKLSLAGPSARPARALQGSGSALRRG